jgi:hypothetical protein
MLQYLAAITQHSSTKPDLKEKSISVLHAVRWLSNVWNEVSRETVAKFFQRAGFNNDKLTVSEEYEEDARLAEVTSCLPLDIKKNVAS